MRKTRKQLAEELWRRLQDGPAFRYMPQTTAFTAFTATEAYRRWAESWILTEVARLVPELRDKLDALGQAKITQPREEQPSSPNGNQTDTSRG